MVVHRSVNEPTIDGQTAMTSHKPDCHSPTESPPSANRTVREVTSGDLLQGQCELLIRHGDELYRLKLTRNGKLILQK